MRVIERPSGPSGLDDIVAAIRRLQQSGHKVPSERVLAGQLNVKRHQLRKALSLLRGTGDLSPARPRRPSTASPKFGEELARLTNPLEVLELRLVMEPGLARLASLRASAFEIAKIIAAATTPANALSGDADLAFHFAVAGAARNHLAIELYKMLRQVGVDARMKIARALSPTCPKRIAQRDAEHRLIAESISQRDPEAAEAAMRSHLLAVQKQIVERTSAGGLAA